MANTFHSKERDRMRKRRNRAKEVLCYCRLCKGECEQKSCIAAIHLKQFGRMQQPTFTASEERLSDDDSFAYLPDLPLASLATDFCGDGTDGTCNDTGNSYQAPITCESAVNSDTDCDESKDYGTENDIDANKEPQERPYEDVLYETLRAQMPLNEGGDATVLETLCRYFTWFTEHPGVSKRSLSDLLELNNKYILPKGNSLPSSYEEAYKFIEPFLLPLQIFHSCPKSCILYRNCSRYKYADLTECPVCCTSRYIGNSKKPKQRFYYFPLGPRLERMFADATISKMLQQHGSCSGHDESGVITDIQDSPMFQEAYQQSGTFKGDPRGLSVQFSTDGMNPFSHGVYSMWPLTLTVLNLPKTVRHLFTSIMLLGIIPGSSDTKLDAYLEVFVDEMIELSGTEMFDGYKKETFSFKVKILNHVLDYPGLNKLFSACGANASQGCMWCEVQGKHMPSLDKTVYLENRRYLQMSSEMRSDNKRFPDKCVEKRGPPCHRSFSDVMYNSLAYEKAPNKSQARNIAKSTGCKSCYSLMLLPEHDRTKQAFPDIMHSLKNVVVAFVDLITGREDTVKVRKQEAELGRFPGCYDEGDNLNESLQGPNSSGIGKKRKVANAKRTLYDAPFRLTKEQLQVADKRLSEIRIPVGFGWKPKTLFSNYSYMKAHDWKEVSTEGIIKYCLQDALGVEQRTTLFSLLDVLTKLCAEQHTKEGINKLKREINDVCALVERDFPVSLQVISFHILRHVVDGIEIQGPTYSWSMWKYERFNSWISRRVMNRKDPEANIMKTYQIYDWCQYMRMSGRLPTADSLLAPEVTDTIDEEDDENDDSTDQLSTDKERATLTHCNSKVEDVEDGVLRLLVRFYSTSITGVAKNMLDVMSRSITKHGKHVEQVSGRWVEWRCMESEGRNNPLRVSSIVCLKLGEERPTFGRIRYFFYHKMQIQENGTEFALVDTYKKKSTVCDAMSRLVSIKRTDKTRQVIIPASFAYMSKPLITAVCASNELCVLNYS